MRNLALFLLLLNLGFLAWQPTPKKSTLPELSASNLPSLVLLSERPNLRIKR
jgi:hypothetical protein